LEWNRGIVQWYAQAVQQYVASTLDINEQKYALYAKNTLWPFTVLDHERAAIGAMQAATTSETVSGEGGPSTAIKAVGGAVSGAATGAMIGASYGSSGGPWGAAIGLVVGGIAGAFL
jgi:hypothetical protein